MLPTLAMRTLRSGDLVLEPQVAAHADALFAVLGDPAIYAYENVPPPSLDWLRERFARLETRTSADGTERWLNWALRLPADTLAGYVQATVHPDGHAFIAYILGSAHWGRGIAARAVQAMADELAAYYGAHTLWAVYKSANARSERLLERLAFEPAPPAPEGRFAIEPDESIMRRAANVPPARREPMGEAT